MVGRLRGRRLPDQVEDVPHVVAGGRSGRCFALVRERHWTWPDQSCLRRFVVVWGSLEDRELRGWEIKLGEHRLAVIDDKPDRVIVGTYRDDPMFCIDPHTGTQLWRNDELRRIERMRPLSGGRRVAARFREKGSRLISVDDGTWKSGARAASIGGDDDHLVVLYDRHPATLVVSGRPATTLDGEPPNVVDVAVGHGRVVLVGSGVQAFGFDGKLAWSLDTPYASHAVVTDEGFRIAIHPEGGATRALEVTFDGVVARDVALPYGFEWDVLGPDHCVTSDAVVGDARTGAVVWDFRAALDRVLDEVFSRSLEAVELEQPKAAPAPASPDDSESTARWVQHVTFGRGLVLQDLEAGKVRVRFDDGTERVLLARVLREPSG